MQYTTGIYKITNTINGKVYIGQSTCIERRLKEHKERAFCVTNRQHDTLLYRAIRKYGLDAFHFEILEKCNQSDLNDKEIYWIKKFCSTNPQYGYNITAGGHCSTPLILTKEKVLQIQHLLQTTSLSQQIIAAQFDVTQRTISYINSGTIWNDARLQYPLRNHAPRQSFCSNCGAPILKTSHLCHECDTQRRRQQHAIQRTVPSPTRDELKAKIRTQNISDVARQYKVSTTTIRRWCKNANLPYSKRYINTINEAQWSVL
ncbi:MAG: GIY-YIG nuclease family protein [Bacteroidaceae bacterium]|nr:GIY-YIG nuclease family protein [Bacteroidaceae bacterium]